jgi:hypothetical protein
MSSRQSKPFANSVAFGAARQKITRSRIAPCETLAVHCAPMDSVPLSNLLCRLIQCSI